MMKALLQWDKEVSYSTWRWYHDHVKSDVPLRLLEASGHGVLWFSAVIGLFLSLKNADVSSYVLLLNLFAGLTLDIVVICIIKPLVARKRPHYNPGHGTELSLQAVDKHSFPSGHATRTSMLTGLIVHAHLMYRKPTSVFAYLSVLWSILVMESRVMLGRHHVLDIVAGAIVGTINALIIIKFGRINIRTTLTVRSKIMDILMRLRP
eukprot:Plantae.Rhodophyta-Purpureofilum_apyrenoidigerum.ctg17560.p1 GENE.Plantae.Rhodophyta-Purpureofilum_apyrenoidigerum.ctg17560~~Plantae.Rhodophyta-Purpureofilum_apyrenoidigerum.ctg17560.p1  ORF type:complete len:207 (-),score=20.56 Plantae.Rhodophyta-Purpureofilum_apyrenoidigerum.ctg17560:312-932(-)